MCITVMFNENQFEIILIHIKADKFRKNILFTMSYTLTYTRGLVLEEKLDANLPQHLIAFGGVAPGQGRG